MADGEARIQTQVMTPEGEVFAGDVYQISLRTSGGQVGVRSRHVPLLARLVASELRLYDSRRDFDAHEARRFAVAEGWVEVFADRARVLVGEAIKPEDLDSASLRERLADAEARLADAEEGSAAFETAERDKLRAEAFLAIASA